MANAELNVFGVVGMLNERDVTIGRKFDKPVEGTIHTVHPIERLEREPQRVAPKRELFLHVHRRQCQVVDASGGADGS